FDLRRGRAGSEGRDAGGAQRVGQARRERRLGSDDDEIDLLVAGRGDETRDVRGGDGEIGGEGGGAGIAGSGVQSIGGVVTAPRPAEGVLAAAPADDQNLHFFLKASENACAARFAESTT